MGRISTGIGLVSGIKSKDIIDQLMELEARPKTLLQTRIDSVNQQKTAYTDMMTRLTGLRISATTLRKPSTFQQAAASSSNSDILTASTGLNPAIGSFQFQVARLVSSQQTISNGVADSARTKLSAGTITLEMGGGELSADTPLAQLNGGAGIRRGNFRITDRSGQSAVIDIGNALTLQDVARKINTSLNIGVQASIGREGLILRDTTGQSTSNLAVQDLGDGFAAADLGIASSVAQATLTGTDINYLGSGTLLNNLNDGRGVRDAGGKADFTITAGDGSHWDINVHNLTTVGSVLDAINTATGGKVRADVAPGANGIRLTDTTAGTLSVVALNDSKAAADLGIAGSASGAITGTPLIASLGTVLLSSLRGGSGLTPGSISITNRAGQNAVVDLSGASTVQDILDRISASGIGVSASLKDSGNGIQVIDSSSGTGSLTIAEAGSTTAADLGIAGTFIDGVARGANLQRQWVSENTLLEDYNGGRGVSPGRLRISSSTGTSAVIDLSSGSKKTLGDVISDINNRAIGVTASINANGDGLLLTDTAGGGAKLTVEDMDGTAAADLGIKGTATATTLDGSFEKTLDVTANDTLETLQKKINDLGFAVSASIVNDGSGAAPFRLSLTARNTGRSGRVTLDAGATSLKLRNLVQAQDAAVFMGGQSEQPLLLTSGTNQLTNVIRGVTVDLHGVSDQPVTLNVTRDSEAVATSLQKFADDFNGIVDKIAELTKFDTDTNQRGLLLGESTMQQVQTQIYTMLQSVVSGAGRYRILADVGLKLGDGAKLEFDAEKFKQATATDPEAVSKLFTLTDKGIGWKIETQINRLIDPVNGVITRENKTLDERTQQFQSRINSLDKLIEAKRTRLENQFASLESVLANLQGQQQAIGQISTISMPSK